MYVDTENELIVKNITVKKEQFTLKRPFILYDTVPFS